MSNEPPREAATSPGEACALTPGVIEAAQRKRPLLKGLLAIAAGFSDSSPAPPRPEFHDQPVFSLVYCVKGAGWCELGGRPRPIRQGDLLLLPPGLPCGGSAKPSQPWSFHWIHAIGTLAPEYFRELSAGGQPLIRVGEAPHLVRLFNEIRQALRRGPSYPALLQASHGLAYLLSVLIGTRQQSEPEDPDTARKIAAAIIYMSEHLDQPLRVSALGRSANLSPAYLSELFKAQAGCSPRDYLHLLRIHRACQLLQTTGLSIKEIANRTGYQDPFHFSRQFKAFQGQSPTEYRAA